MQWYQSTVQTTKHTTLSLPVVRTENGRMDIAQQSKGNPKRRGVRRNVSDNTRPVTTITPPRPTSSSLALHRLLLTAIQLAVLSGGHEQPVLAVLILAHCGR